jgi:hypothetical protein
VDAIIAALNILREPDTTSCAQGHDVMSEPAAVVMVLHFIIFFISLLDHLQHSKALLPGYLQGDQ